ncbi:hypothetical protein [Aquimarina algiphila]|uniref:hypothetical protein n=1 Tax=Aquimarina algiphila TaxID=2047982 RepID=UPI0024937611|nr:hypothetical protein [Aquimarina algiphila]
MKKFVVLGLLALGTFAFANTPESTKEVKIDEEDAFCNLERCVTYTPDDGGPSGTFCYCVDVVPQ